MRFSVRQIFCAILTAMSTAPGVAVAQDPFAVAPQAYKVQFENDWVRVIRVHYAPHEKIPVHDHPKRQVIFIYLNDGGPVRFKHVEGYSGSYNSIRPATKAGAYRLAGVQPENHEVENTSDVPSDFLQVELKTEAVDIRSFHGRYLPDDTAKQKEPNYRKVEFDNGQIRITRIVCAAAGKCNPIGLDSNPALLIALSPARFKVATKEGKRKEAKLEPGGSEWLEAPGWPQLQNVGKDPAENLLIEFKTRPGKPAPAEEHKDHKHDGQ
jgi:hypothetical protein